MASNEGGNVRAVDIAEAGALPWVNGPAYLEGDHVVLDPQRAHKCLIDPFADGEVLFRFLDIRDPRDIPPFVHRYGLLRQGPNEKAWREPVEDWLATAKHLRLVLTIYCAYLRALQGDMQALRDISLQLAYADVSRGLADIDRLGALDVADPDLVLMTGEWITQHITAWLQPCRVGMDVARNNGRLVRQGDFVWSLRPPDLLCYISLEAAYLMGNQKVLARCPGCPGLFVPQNERQQFCTPECGARDRSRRQRSTLRAPTSPG